MTAPTKARPLHWDTDNEDCAYNSVFGYHVANFCGIYVLRGPLCESSRHKSMELAKAAAQADIEQRMWTVT